MKTIIKTLFLLSIAYSAQSQTMDLSPFEEVSVSSGHSVTLIQSDQNYAEIKMIKGDRENLEVYVSGDELKVKTKSGLWNSSKTKAEVKIYYAQKLHEIDASSGSSISSYDIVKTDRLSIDASSGAKCDIKVESNELDIDVSSGAKVKATGDAGSQTVDVSSGAKYDGKELLSEYTVAEASSGAKAIVYCSKRIKADSSSGGNVVYYGKPSDIDADAGKWSGGSIKAGK